MQSSVEAANVTTIPVHPVTMGWFFKRLLLGVAILVVAVGSVAWLTYASIDPALEQDQAEGPAAAGQDTPIQSASQQN